MPEFLQTLEAVLRRISGDQRRIDRTNGRADHPVDIDAGLLHRLVDAELIGAQRAAALQDEHDLPRQCQVLRPLRCHRSPRWFVLPTRDFIAWNMLTRGYFL